MQYVYHIVRETVGVVSYEVGTANLALDSFPVVVQYEYAVNRGQRKMLLCRHHATCGMERC